MSTTYPINQCTASDGSYIKYQYNTNPNPSPSPAQPTSEACSGLAIKVYTDAQCSIENPASTAIANIAFNGLGMGQCQSFPGTTQSARLTCTTSDAYLDVYTQSNCEGSDAMAVIPYGTCMPFQAGEYIVLTNSNSDGPNQPHVIPSTPCTDLSIQIFNDDLCGSFDAAATTEQMYFFALGATMLQQCQSIDQFSMTVACNVDYLAVQAYMVPQCQGQPLHFSLPFDTCVMYPLSPGKYAKLYDGPVPVTPMPKTNNSSNPSSFAMALRGATLGMITLLAAAQF